MLSTLYRKLSYERFSLTPFSLPSWVIFVTKPLPLRTSHNSLWKDPNTSDYLASVSVPASSCCLAARLGVGLCLLIHGQPLPQQRHLWASGLCRRGVGGGGGSLNPLLVFPRYRTQLILKQDQYKLISCKYWNNSHKEWSRRDPNNLTMCLCNLCVTIGMWLMELVFVVSKKLSFSPKWRFQKGEGGNSKILNSLLTPIKSQVAPNFKGVDNNIQITQTRGLYLNSVQMVARLKSTNCLTLTCSFLRRIVIKISSLYH